MKRIIVYYSLEGNTEYIANKLAEVTGADKLRLIPKKEFPKSGFSKFFWGGKSAVMAEKPDLEQYDFASDYDEIIIGFPVWAGNITPPIRTFVADNLEKLKGKKISAFACQSGAGAEKAFEKLKSVLGIDSLSETAIFIDPKDKPSEQNDLTLEVFSKKIMRQ